MEALHRLRVRVPYRINYAIAPVLMAVFVVWLPPVVLDDVIKMLVLILSGT